MNSAALMWFEILFDITYLALIWGLVISLARRTPALSLADRPVARRVVAAFALLGIGDLGHVGFRVVAYALGDLETIPAAGAAQLPLVGLGSLITAVTVTLFYVALVELWRARYGRPLGAAAYALFAAAAVRLVLLALPQNEWWRLVPPQPWSALRNLPLAVQGLGVMYLIWRDARAAGDRSFAQVAALIGVSFAFWLPVVLFVDRAPALGMLMVPKTLAYLAMLVVLYRELTSGERRLGRARAGAVG